jgi:hypothetical protein
VIKLSILDLLHKSAFNCLPTKLHLSGLIEVQSFNLAINALRLTPTMILLLLPLIKLQLQLAIVLGLVT